MLKIFQAFESNKLTPVFFVNKRNFMENKNAQHK